MTKASLSWQNMVLHDETMSLGKDMVLPRPGCSGCIYLTHLPNPVDRSSRSIGQWKGPYIYIYVYMYICIYLSLYAQQLYASLQGTSNGLLTIPQTETHQVQSWGLQWAHGKMFSPSMFGFAGCVTTTLRVQVPKYKLSTPNHNITVPHIKPHKYLIVPRLPKYKNHQLLGLS